MNLNYTVVRHLMATCAASNAVTATCLFADGCWQEAIFSVIFFVFCVAVGFFAKHLTKLAHGATMSEE